MTKVPVPDEISQRIAQKAVQYAREDVARRGWHSSGAIQPTFKDGQVGLTSTVKYLIYQDQGIRPYLMYWVEGRKVPLSCKQGDGPHVRVGRDVGKPGYVNIPHKGQTWRSQKWRHPGIKPKRFLKSALQRAIKESKAEIKAESMRALKGEA